MNSSRLFARSAARSIQIFFLYSAFLCLPLAVANAAGERTGSNLQAWLGINPFRMIGQSDLIGKLALIALAAISIASWGVIVGKWKHLNAALADTEGFLRACNQGNGELDEVFRLSADYPASPLAQIARETYVELDVEDWYRLHPGLDQSLQFEMARAGIERMLDRTITHEVSNLERRLIFLATTVSVCPFIGLFGTVWGIMVAFQGFGMDQNVSIDTLAPGLSTALLTTVGGLFCAIPASVMYNDFINKIKYLTTRMDTFALELGGIIQKRVLTRMGGMAAAAPAPVRNVGT